MSLLRASRLSALMTKTALLGAALKAGKFLMKPKVLGTGLVAGVTGMGVNQALNRSRAGATPEWVEASRNRGVPAAPQF